MPMNISLKILKTDYKYITAFLRGFRILLFISK